MSLVKKIMQFKAAGLKYTYNKHPIIVSRITDFSPDKQAEWSAIGPIDKNANKGLETLAPQKTESAFKNVTRGG